MTNQNSQNNCQHDRLHEHGAGGSVECLDCGKRWS